MDAESKIDVNVFDVVKHGIKRSKVIMYKDNDSWVRSIFSQLINISSHGNKRVVIFGLNNLSTKLATMLCEIGVEVILTAPDEDTDNVRAATASLNRLSIEGAKPVLFREFGPEAAAGADVVVGLAPGKAVVDSSAVKAMRKGGLIVDGSLGSLTPSAVRAANRLGIEMVRVDMGPAISAEVAMGIRMIDLVKKGMGRRKIDGVMCVAGGLFGSSGDVVLDSITDPNLVVGIADGRGGILRGVRGRQKNRNKVERIENSIALAKIV
jgi:hypothetical protein